MMNKIRRQKPTPKPEKPERPSFAQYLKQKSRTKWAFGESDRFKRLRFAGFHERMQKIDVKLAHNPERVAGLELRPFEEADLMTSQTSAFIDALNSHNMLDESLDYQAVSKTLAPLSSTFPMVVNNMGQIVDIIADRMGKVDKDCRKALIEFAIALIKDARQLIFPAFLSKLMPALVKLVQVDDVDTLDRVFTAFSYAFKFLQKPIVEHLPEVYLCYYELLAHNNKYIRKFAAESFSFIIRTFKRRQGQKLMEILLDPIMNPQKYLELPAAGEKDEPSSFSFHSAFTLLAAAPKDEQTDSLFDSVMRSPSVLASDKGIKLQLSPQTKENIAFSVSQLAAEAMAGTQGATHSKAAEFLQALFSSVFVREKVWLEISYICRYCVALLVDYLDPSHDRVVYDALEEAFKPVYKTCFHPEGEGKALTETEELQLNLVVTIWKEWIALNEGKKISQFCVVQILQNMNCLLCQNAKLFEKLAYLTKKNVLQCVALIYTLKHNVCIDIYQLNNPSLSKTSSNLLKRQLFELRPARLLYDFVRFLTDGYESPLRMSMLIGDYNFLKTVLTVSIPAEKQRFLLSPLFDNYMNNTMAMMNETAEYEDLKRRVLCGLKMADILGREPRVSKECVEGAAKLLSSKNQLWKAWLLDAEESMVQKQEDSGADLVDLCLFLDLMSRNKNVATLDPKELAKVAKRLTGRICANIGKDAVVKYSQESYTSKRLTEFACTNFVFPSTQASAAHFYVIAFSRVTVLLSDSSPLVEAFSLLCQVLISQRTNEYLLDALERLLQRTVEAKDLAVVDLASRKIAAGTILTSPETPAKSLADCVAAAYSELRRNLTCNLRAVRLKSLRMMNTYFADPDDCGMVKLLLKLEEPEVALETERDKLMAVRDIKLLLGTNKVTLPYNSFHNLRTNSCLKSCTLHSFGTLWNKFSPLHTAAEDMLHAVLESYETQRAEAFDCFLPLVQAVLNISSLYPAADQVAGEGAALTVPQKDLYYEEYVRSA